MFVAVALWFQFTPQTIHFFRPMFTNTPAAMAPNAAIMQKANEKWRLDAFTQSLVTKIIIPNNQSPPVKIKKYK